MTARLLVVDDEKLIRWSIRERLENEGYEIIEAVDGSSAVNAFAENAFDLVLLDIRLPDSDGIAIMKDFRTKRPDIPVILITAFSSVDSAVEAMKLGAYDYVTKPFNLDELSISVRRALETGALRSESGARIQEAKDRYGLENVIGNSPSMQDICSLIQKVSASEAKTVLLRGESGTGKDVIARAIHYESNRANKHFLNITCTALQETLLESELFGHEKGSFTDAKIQKKGLFELANGGTIFLDEIGDMSPALQGKLLRVLEERAFRRIGGTKDIRVDVCVVAATNRDLEKAIDDHSFREDLYYRLNIIPIVIPPLRERTEDIEPLVDHFLQQFNHEFRKKIREIDNEGISKLLSYHWPGNIRELRNVLERACLLASEDRISAEDLLIGRAAYSGKADTDDFQFRLPQQGTSLDNVEKQLVQQALERTVGNQSRAAQLLGISRDQVRYKMRKYGIVTEPNATGDVPHGSNH